MKIKTIDVHSKQWFDRTYGNTYFDLQVTINYGMKTQKSFEVPMQYGYGDQYRHEAFKELRERGFIKDADDRTVYWQYFQDHNIIARYNLQNNCKKRDLIK